MKKHGLDKFLVAGFGVGESSQVQKERPSGLCAERPSMYTEVLTLQDTSFNMEGAVKKWRNAKIGKIFRLSISEI